MSAPAVRRIRRPMLILTAVVIGLSGVGTAAGMALGAVGATSSEQPGGMRHHAGTGHVLDDARTR